MSDSSLPENTEGNTYIIDPESAPEMARLLRFDQFTTKAMGGPLTGLPLLPPRANILDIACGPGGWVLDVAFANPQAEVAGIDISKTMINYAVARAHSQDLHNATFEVMDATKPLNFSDQAFDLVNGRMLTGFLRRETWPSLIAECRRILRPGGIVRITETDLAGLTNSPAFEELSTLGSRAAWLAGYGFSLNGRPPTTTHKLGRMLREAGFQNVRYQAHVIEFSTETEAWGDFCTNSTILFNVMQPLLLKTGVATQEEIDKLYQQMQIEMRSEDFCGIWPYMTVWGIAPE